MAEHSGGYCREGHPQYRLDQMTELARALDGTLAAIPDDAATACIQTTLDQYFAEHGITIGKATQMLAVALRRLVDHRIVERAASITAERYPDGPDPR